MKHQFFKNSYFPSIITEWNKLDSNVRNSETLKPNEAGLFEGSFFLFLFSFFLFFFWGGGGSMKIDENSLYWRRNSSYLLNHLRNFNEIFRKDVNFDNIKSHKKTGFHPLFRRYIFRKTTGGVQLTPLPNPPPNPSRFRVKIFKSKMLKFIRPTANSIFGYHNPKATN